MRFNKRLAGVIGALALVIAGAAVAYAFFNATGTGSGTARAVTAVQITINATPCTSADLYPGGPAGAVCFTLTNSNAYAVNFTFVQYPVSPAITSSITSCAASNVGFATGRPTTVNFTVLAGQTTGTLSIPGVLQMSSSAPDQCQGSNFTVPLALIGLQQ